MHAIKPVIGNLGISIVTTNQGVMTNKQARACGVAVKFSVRFGKDRDSMSKIGRKPITLGGVTVEIKGKEIHYKGKKHLAYIFLMTFDS